MAQTEVYAPKSVQLWRTVLDWLAFLVQIFVQIVRSTSSLAQVFNCIGFSQGCFLSPPPPGFKPLPVVEIPLESAAVDIASEDGAHVLEAHDVVADGGERLPKLTSILNGGDAVTDGYCIVLFHGHTWQLRNVVSNLMFSGRISQDLWFKVVLDLDETLVCAYETSSLPPALCSEATEAGLKWFDLECVSSDKEFEGKPKISYVTVFERPGLHEFLKRLSEFADLILFTAGLEGYARPLVDQIDVDGLFSGRLYRPSTISTEYRDHVKDLTCISQDLCRVVIVDNNPFSFLLQPLNGIPCVPFSAGQPHDNQLLEVLLPLLKILSVQKDIRPFLYEKFHMPEWFQKHGIPSPGWTL